MEFVLSTATYILLVTVAAVLALLSLVDRKCKAVEVGTTNDVAPPAPGPRAWPIIGSLHLMAGYRVPFQAFTDLSRVYGKVFSMKLGSVPCLVVNGYQNIREVLITKSNHFDGRPDFPRYHRLFESKENSIAFCDWSETQKLRREMLRAHVFPRAFSARFNQLDSLVTKEVGIMMESLEYSSRKCSAIPTKSLLLETCANIFTSHFCSKRFSKDDPGFQTMVTSFDKIFYDINQGYAADFLPWLMPFVKKEVDSLVHWGHEIRKFIVHTIIDEKKSNMAKGLPSNGDLTDNLLEHLDGPDAKLTDDEMLFTLEDIVGGHSAVGNFVMKMLVFVAHNQTVQQRLQDEIDAVTNGARSVSLEDRPNMPYTDAVFLETLRHISSPIVPHRANQDSTISGFQVPKGTLIFMNNHDLNMNEKLWEEPNSFMPERFIVDDGIVKPEFFLPFGAGRRSCLGYKLMQWISFSMLASIMQKFDVSPLPGEDYTFYPGAVSLPLDKFSLCYHKRPARAC